MGGNFRYETDGKLISGDSLKFRSENARNKFTTDVKEMLSSLNEKFNSTYDKALWPDLEGYIADLLIFGGSTEHIFDPSISDEEFSYYKETFSDLDIYIPSAGSRGFLLMNLLDQNKGSMLGPKFKIIGTKVHPNENLANDRGTNSIFQYMDGKGNPYIQFDFMPQPIPTGEEDEKTAKSLKAWVKLSHSSNWRDVQQAVKGVFHKYLLQSLVSVRSRIPGMILTPKSPLPPGPIKQAKDSDYDLYLKSLSVEKGLGKGRLTPQMIVDPETGEEIPAEFQGKKLYKKTPPEEKKESYSTDVEEIFESAFGFLPEGDDLEKMRSFVGLLDIMREKVLPGEGGREFCGKVLKSFFYKLVGEHGQEISTYSEAKDIKPKAAAIAVARMQGFGDILDEVLPADVIEQTLEKYYERFREKMSARGSLASSEEELAPVELEENLRRLIRGILNA